MTTMTGTKLNPDTIYISENGEFVCGTPRCAGSTALATGVSIGGTRLSAVTPEDTREWASYDMGPLRCTCGRLTATALADSHGHAICHAD